MSENPVLAQLLAMKDPRDAERAQRFFKTGPGEYGEGDIFLGITNPRIRAVAKQYKELEESFVLELLHSPYHEARFTALVILTLQYQKRRGQRERIYQLYMESTDYINNWDLVDCSAPQIPGAYLMDHKDERMILYDFAWTPHLWKQRIAILSTFTFIREYDFEDTLKLSEILRDHEHDLIHKAVGWMLREVGNRSMQTEEMFLREHYRQMPRTMLRYAIEKFPEDKRQAYLKGKI